MSSGGLVIDLTWPDGTGSEDDTALPLPYVDYAGSNRNATITSTIEGGPYLRRSRFDKYYIPLLVSWRLNEAELAALRRFFETALGNGSAAFALELRYPKNTELTTWKVRFVGGYSCEFLDGLWAVSARLDLLDKDELEDQATLLGLSTFQVIDETESSGYTSFNVLVDSEFQVTE